MYTKEISKCGDHYGLLRNKVKKITILNASEITIKHNNFNMSSLFPSSTSAPADAISPVRKLSQRIQFRIHFLLHFQIKLSLNYAKEGNHRRDLCLCSIATNSQCAQKKFQNGGPLC